MRYLIILLLALSSCTTGNSEKKVVPKTGNQKFRFYEYVLETNDKKDNNIEQDTATKFIKVLDIITIVAKPAIDDFGYNPISILFKDSLIHNDLKHFYNFDSEDFFFARQLYDDLFELILEFDDRPSKNKLLQFFITSKGVIKTKELAIFFFEAKNLDEDETLELAGFLENGERISNDKDSMLYNPILIYEVTESGILLDSLTTIDVNQEIWGKFYGFYYNENLHLKGGLKLREVLKRIKEK